MYGYLKSSVRKLPVAVNSRLSALWVSHGAYELFNLLHDIEIISSFSLPVVIVTKLAS
jgi:hypothetical protein